MLEPVDYAHDSPTTGGLGRLRTTGSSVFLKLVQAPRHWKRWPTLPPAAREALTLVSSRWRQEADLYESDLGAALPVGMRLPTVHGVVDLGDDRVLLVLEDVDADPSPWDPARFASAARLLGRLQARMTDRGPFISAPQEPCELLQQLFRSRLVPVTLPALTAEATWRHPLLAAERPLRGDIAELARRLPALIEAATRLPQLQAHGDTTPHNLLVPRDRPDTFVVIDWAMANLGPVGDDLGQMLIGLAHDGVLDVAGLATLHHLLVAEYTAGLADEGHHVGEDLVLAGMNTGLAVRSAFTALPVERLGEPIDDELAEHLQQRLALTRYLVDLALDTVAPVPHVLSGSGG
ncbi:MAG: phosphotransferase [Ilumatobacteraceae bacterium]